MRREPLLLRFEDRRQAISVLGEIGIAFDAVSGDGIIRKPTGETAEFEGEVVALTCPVSGYHVRLVWRGELPCSLAPYLVDRGAFGQDQSH
ncbi:hypothetical protein J2X76_001222 [Neorhizobium sp. 2083]|uniref:hypothetical protein n=1 Tax=Neorhizobium sp. 2083 TaxID=2817762 RepID=UPI0028545AC0|nr:hypothetical protein [Neorhizobium sp. 2083]MDR6816068.1 hypothetical protein [Neorhizobium sp. 2083]